MKQVVVLLLLIVNINAQQSDILKFKYGSEEFEGLTFDNYLTEKSITKLPALLKSSITNSNPEFLSATYDSVYEDSTYIFNVLTNDPDPNDITVSVASNPSWLTLTAIAGGGISNITQYPYGENNLATQTLINTVTDVEVDNSGNLYYVDLWLHVIRKIGSDGKISNVAGSYNEGYSGDGGTATSAKLNRPSDIAFDSNGNMYIADFNNHRIRKVDTNGIISTVAGTGESGFSGDGGAATSAKISYPYGVAIGSSDNIYIAEWNNNRIRKVDTNGIISTVAGTGESGFSGDGGAAKSAQISSPDNILFYNNSLYIADTRNKRIRKIENVNSSDSENQIITSIAGSDMYNGDNILASTAHLEPRNPAFDKDGNLYFAERTTHRVRKIDTNGVLTTVAGNETAGYSGDGGLGTSAQISSPRSVTVDNNGNIYISDVGNSRIRKVDTNGIITTYAGTGESGYSGDGDAATSAKINFPYQLTTDQDGNLYFADAVSGMVRKVDTNGIITTVAGTGAAGYGGDGGAATSALLNAPLGVDIDPNGNIYIADASNHIIRKVDTNGIITTVAGTPGSAGYVGDGGAATSALFNYPSTVHIDNAGNIYICDTYNSAIRKIWKSGIITTIAGTGERGYSEHSTGTEAYLNRPWGFVLDSLNNVYITDTGNKVIRKLDASYHTLTGTPTNSDVGTTTMTFTASDGQGGSATQSFALKVINTNDAPVLTSVTNVTTNEDTAKTVTLSGTDVDGDALTYSAVSDTSAVTVSVSSSTLTLTPNANWHGTASITAYASDGYSKDSTSFTLTVNPVSDIAAVQDVTIDEDKSTEVTLTSTFTGTTTFTAVSDTSAVTTSISSSTLTLTPNANWYGVANIKAYASDGSSKDSTSFTLTVTAVNDSPLITAVADDSTNEETEKGIVVGASDVDGDALTYSATSDTSGVAVTISTDTLKLTPSLNYTGTSVITVIVSDNALTDTTKFDFKVLNVNDAPVIAAVSDVTFAEDTTGSLVLSATDIDGDAVTYSAKSSRPDIVTAVSKDTLTLTPAANWNGVANITAYASDGTAKDSTSFKLTVTSVNDAPVISAVPDDSTNEEIEKTIVLSASDIDGDALTYTATSDTSAVGLTVSSDTLKLTPALNYSGTSVITVIVSDNALTDTTKFDFKVINVNDAPVIATVDDDSTQEDSDGKGLKLSASDVEGDALTYSAVSDTTGLTVSVLNDSISLKPVPDYFGTSIVKVFVSDGQLTDSTTFTFKVLNIQDAPKAFEWISTSLDSINISQSNLTDVYDLDWSESIDVDLEEVDYLLYAQVGVNPAEEIGDTTSTSVQLTYEDLVVNVFDSFQVLPRATVRFSLHATDGIDTVKVTGDDRVLFINRYDYLSTEEGAIPTEFALHENYPNPFNPTTTLRFDLPEMANVTVTIYNMLGQIVRTFNMNDTPAGYHSIKWDATNDYGDPVGAGVYLYQLRANEFVKTKKMVLLK